MIRRSLLLAPALAVLLSACGGSSAAPGTGPSSTQARDPAALVQVENSAAARPQWGLQDAAVVYEYVTEGGISRFSVLYTSTPPSRIGPVRSARLVTIHLAKLYGAVIVYSGASTAVQKALDSSGVPHADEKASQGALYRIGERPAPHNLVTDGDHLAQLLSRYRGQAPGAPSLWSRSTTAPAGAGRAVTRVTVSVSGGETPVFSFDSAAGGWSRSEPDSGAVKDAGSKAPVVAGTVIVQQVSITETSDVEDVNGVHGVDITVTGSGSAQVFTAGKEYDATWSQPSSGPPSFTLPGGGAAPIASGLVWICLVPTGSSATAA